MSAASTTKVVVLIPVGIPDDQEEGVLVQKLTVHPAGSELTLDKAHAEKLIKRGVVEPA